MDYLCYEKHTVISSIILFSCYYYQYLVLIAKDLTNKLRYLSANSPCPNVHWKNGINAYVIIIISDIVVMICPTTRRWRPWRPYSESLGESALPPPSPADPGPRAWWTCRPDSPLFQRRRAAEGGLWRHLSAVPPAILWSAAEQTTWTRWASQGSPERSRGPCGDLEGTGPWGRKVATNIISKQKIKEN